MNRRSNAIIDQYHHILLLIELEVIEHHQKNPDLTDHEVNKVYDAVQRVITKELRSKKPPTLRLSQSEQELFDEVLATCRAILNEDEKITIHDEDIQSIPPETLILCLKELQKSLRTWAEHGRRGYLTYINQFFDMMEDK